MSEQEQHLVGTSEAQKIIGIRSDHVRLLCRSGRLTGKQRSVRYWLCDPRPEVRDWRSCAEAGTELGLTRLQIIRLCRAGELRSFHPHKGLLLIEASSIAEYKR